MEIVKEFAAELQIQFVVELVDAVADVFRLHFQVLLVIKTNFHIKVLLCIEFFYRFATDRMLKQMFRHGFEHIWK